MSSQNPAEDGGIEPEEFDPEEIADAIAEAQEDIVGQKYCIRAQHCIRKISCEHAQQRNQTTELLDLFEGKAADFNDCSNWRARRELGGTLDIPRRSGSQRRRSRHNQHANREAAVRELIRKIDAGEPIPQSPYTPEELRNMLNHKREAAIKKILQRPDEED